jgi:REP-associated tyrosine transposase
VTHDSRINHRRTIRLSGWDYSKNGVYFVTLCAEQRECLFGEIVDGRMRLNTMGAIVANTWRWLPLQYKYVILDEWCVMPNHLHGLLVLTDRRDSPRRDGSHLIPPAITCDRANPGNDPTLRNEASTGGRRKPVGQFGWCVQDSFNETHQ